MKKNIYFIILILSLIVSLFTSCSEKNITVQEKSFENEFVEKKTLKTTEEAIKDIVKKDDILNVDIIPEETSAQVFDNKTEETKSPNVSNEHDTEVSQGKKTICSLEIRCDTILSNMSKLTKNKRDIIPSDGVIFKKQSINFEEGESVFNMLLRTLRENGIQLEYEKTPSLNSIYIEGIANIYEFDCGSMSGWIYKVNGKSQDCGCSDYILKNGDFVEWIYSCNLGSDIY